MDINKVHPKRDNVIRDKMLIAVRNDPTVNNATRRAYNQEPAFCADKMEQVQTASPEIAIILATIIAGLAAREIETISTNFTLSGLAQAYCADKVDIYLEDHVMRKSAPYA